MKLYEIKQEPELSKNKLIEGTSCSSCNFTKDTKCEPVKKSELNKFGGIHSTDTEDLKRAKSADVITMPGAVFPEKKCWCKNPKIIQWVTERMCCNFWDAPGIKTQKD